MTKRSRDIYRSLSPSTSEWYAILDSRDALRADDRAFRSLFVGRRLGQGMTRMVHEYIGPGVPKGKYVIKFEDAERDGHFQNVTEWNIWNTAESFKQFSRWLAPCVAISLDGRMLIQARTTKRPASAYPKRVPAFFGDMKHRNYGWIGNQLVCHDYGTWLWNVLPDKVQKTKRAEWTSNE